eukprot:5427302-Prorocentrum_lima.AAC.1
MTSSLVGSEMCIRDRATAWPPWRIPRAVKEGEGASRRGSHGRRRRRRTVSYTHLTLPTICSV